MLRFSSRVPALALVIAAGLAALPALETAAFAGKKVQEAPLTIEVETAEQLYVKLEYEKANSIAGKVIERGNLTHDQLVRVFRIHAITYAILGNEEEATDAFTLLLGYAPDFQLDADTSPKVVGPFQEAKGYWKAQPSRPGLDVEAQVRSSASGVLRIKTVDPTRIVRKVVVSQRWGSTGTFLARTLDGSQGSVEIPAPPVGGTRIDYYVQAFDDRNNTVMENGSANMPRSAFVEAPADKPPAAESKSILSSPIFWAVAGAVVVGGGVGTYFALQPSPATTARVPISTSP